MVVGKLQDVVSAAVVVNAAERSNSNAQGANQNASAFDSPAATVETNQSRFIIDGKSIQTDADSNAKKKADDVDIQLKKPITEETLENITQELNKLMSKINANLEFNYHKEAGMFSVALVDKETNEVIKELPPEEMVKNIVKGKIWMDAFIGTIVDTNA